MVAVLNVSCKNEERIPCDVCEPPDWVSSIHYREVKTDFKNGIYQMDCIINNYEEEECEAYLLLALRHPVFDPNRDLFVRGFGNDVKVDGFTICSYHQLSMERPILANNRHYDSVTFEFPVFLKKIKVPKKPFFNEKINILLPDGFTSCWAEIAIFINSKDIEESMKTKLDPEMLKNTYNENKNFSKELDRYKFKHYYSFFPDSSLFSYLTTNLGDLGLGFCDNIGMRTVDVLRAWNCCGGLETFLLTRFSRRTVPWPQDGITPFFFY